MKSSTILFALVSTAAANVRLPQLEERALDPATMDPARFSVLKVLKSAMPSGTNVPMPNADFKPEWYQKLPTDVKQLLPDFYPVIGAAIPTSEVLAVSQSTSAAATVGESSTTSTSASTSMSTSLASSSASSASSVSSASVESTLVSVSASLTASSSVESSSSSSSSPSPSESSTSETLSSSLESAKPSSLSSASPTSATTFRSSNSTLTRSSQQTPLSTGSMSKSPIFPTNGTTLAAGSSPKPTAASSSASAAATSSRPANGGVKMAVKTEMLAAVAWVCVGAGFVIFA